MELHPLDIAATTEANPHFPTAFRHANWSIPKRSKRFTRAVGASESDLRPQLGPGTHIGPDGLHSRRPGLKASELKSPWARTERLKVRVIPEHSLGQKLNPRNEFERTFHAPCPVKYGARQRGPAQLAPLDDAEPEPGPGAHEMGAAFDSVSESRTQTSKGVAGLRSGSKRFSPQPDEIERFHNPPPGAYGDPANAPKGDLEAPVRLAPKDPDYEWKREEVEGRASPTFNTTRNFPLLSDYDRSRVLAATGIIRGFNAVSGPGNYWSKQTQADSQRAGPNPYSKRAAKMESKKGSAPFLSSVRNRPGPRALIQQRLRLREGPDNHFSLQKERLKWREAGAGRGGFGASFARTEDRFTDWKGNERALCKSTAVSRHQYEAAQRQDQKDSEKMVQILGFDPAHNFEAAMQSLEISRVGQLVHAPSKR